MVQFSSATIRLSYNFNDPQIICWNYIVLGCHHIRGLNWNVSSVLSVLGGHPSCTCFQFSTCTHTLHFKCGRQAIGTLHMHKARSMGTLLKYMWCTHIASSLRGVRCAGCCQRCHRNPCERMRVPWKQLQIPVHHSRTGAPNLCVCWHHGLSKPLSHLHWLRSVTDCKTLINC
jgi:hypothetical protein